MKHHIKALRACLVVTMIAALSLSPMAAHALKDLGMMGEFSGLYNVDGPAITTYKGHRMLYYSGAPTFKQMGMNGIFFSRLDQKGWSYPTLSFSKPGYAVKDPSIVKHPRRNQYYMLYTMKELNPTPVEEYDPKLRKRVTRLKSPTDKIGIAYATACRNSPDGSGLCWTDLSKDSALIGGKKDKNKHGGKSPSAHLEGTKLTVYYKANPPENALRRNVYDIRDWKLENSKPILIQHYNETYEQWETYPQSGQTAINDVDVKPYGKGYLMVGNVTSSNIIGRWISKDGLHFFKDPNEYQGPILREPRGVVKSPSIEVTGKHDFLVYYAHGDEDTPCTQKFKASGSLLRCADKIRVNRMAEQSDPKRERNNWYDPDFVMPDYDSVQPAQDQYQDFIQGQDLQDRNRPTTRNTRTGKTEDKGSIWSIFD